MMETVMLLAIVVLALIYVADKVTAKCPDCLAKNREMEINDELIATMQEMLDVNEDLISSLTLLNRIYEQNDIVNERVISILMEEGKGKQDASQDNSNDAQDQG